MTVSVKAPTSTTGSIQLNGSDVLTIESDNSVDIDSGTLYVDATNNRVGIGTSSPAFKLEIVGGTNNGIHLKDADSATVYGGLFTQASVLALVARSNHGLTFGTNDAERMRIDSSGNVLVGGTTVYGSCKTTIDSGSGNSLACRLTNTGASYALWYYNSTITGSIGTNGTTTSYNTSSDYRLKENVAPMSGSIDRLKKLKPSTWSWTQDGSHGEGFLAHEAQTVVPEAVHGTKDEVDDEGNPVYQGIDQSKLVPLLTAALQEAITKIEDLETRIQTLENPNG